MLLINKLDNVEVNISDGHKYARRDILRISSNTVSP